MSALAKFAVGVGAAALGAAMYRPKRDPKGNMTSVEGKTVLVTGASQVGFARTLFRVSSHPHIFLQHLVSGGREPPTQLPALHPELLNFASQGLGKIFANKAVDGRAGHVILWDVDQNGLTKTCDELRLKGGKVRGQLSTPRNKMLQVRRCAYGS